MKINKKKLGFTLVELLVVIAILAVLATVAIIGYSSFINEAHKSNDNSVVTELNHYLKAANPLGDEIPTATDAAEKLEGCGLNIAELQPSAKDAYYGYNYKSSEFVYIEDILNWQEDGQSASAERKLSTFVFAKKEGQVSAAYTNGYSVYLQKDYNCGTGNYANTDFKAVNGLDVGEASVTAVNYTNTTSTAKDVVIRTNGGTLTIDAPNDTVKHYGDAIVVDVQAVASSSYHEYGTVSFAKIKTGRIVVTEEAEIGGIHILATESGNDKVYQSISVAVVGNAELPTLTRDLVTEESNDNYAILVVEVQTLATEETVANNTNTEKIWVVGITENETKTVSTIATDISATSSNASNNAKTEETLSESAMTLVSSESTVAESIEEEEAQTNAIIEVLPELSQNSFSLSTFDFTSKYGGEYIGIMLNNAPSTDPGDYNWESSDTSIADFNKFYDADDNPFEVLLTEKLGKALITATLKSDNSIKAYYVFTNDTEPTEASIYSTNNYVTPDISADLQLTLTARTKTGDHTTNMTKKNYGDYNVTWSIVSGGDIATITELENTSVFQAVLQFSAEGSAEVELTITSPKGTTQTDRKVFNCYTTPVADVDGTNYYSFNDAWKYARNNGGTVKLHKDVVCEQSATVNGVTYAYLNLRTAGRSVTLDLNGHSMSFSESSWSRFDTSVLTFFEVKNGTLTITDTSTGSTGRIDTTLTNTQGEGTSAIVSANSANCTIVIAGGNFVGTPIYKATTSIGSVSIIGGTFDSQPSYVASGYTAQDNGNGTWTVVANS